MLAGVSGFIRVFLNWNEEFTQLSCNSRLVKILALVLEQKYGLHVNKLRELLHGSTGGKFSKRDLAEHWCTEH